MPCAFVRVKVFYFGILPCLFGKCKGFLFFSRRRGVYLLFSRQRTVSADGEAAKTRLCTAFFPSLRHLIGLFLRHRGRSCGSHRRGPLSGRVVRAANMPLCGLFSALPVTKRRVCPRKSLLCDLIFAPVAFDRHFSLSPRPLIRGFHRRTEICRISWMTLSQYSGV